MYQKFLYFLIFVIIYTIITDPEREGGDYFWMEIYFPIKKCLGFHAVTEILLVHKRIPCT